MPTTRRRKRRTSYHHGDLRTALVAAGRELVESEGALALKLREVARRAGVSHMAPYNHFADRGALVAAVAAEGFRDLCAQVERAMARERIPGRQLQEAGIAYVRFAVVHPELFRLMMSPELADKSMHEELRGEADRLWSVLTGAVTRSGTEVDRAAPPGIVPLVAWSLVHGLAVLLVDGQLGVGADVEEASRLAKAATDTLWRGLSHAGA